LNAVRGIFFVVTPTPGDANSYDYQVARYNVAVSPPATVAPFSRALIAPATQVTADFNGNPIPTGNGKLTKVTSGGTITDLTMTGTFPPSATAASINEVVTTGVDTLNIRVQRTALATPANSYHYALNGYISTTTLADSTKTLTESLDTGSYVNVDETNSATTGGSKALIGKLIGTLQTAATKLTGTFDLSAPSADADGLNYIATHVVFNGSISNIAGVNQGQFITGTLDMLANGYNTYHSTTGDTASNYAHGVATLTGTLQAPGRPIMSVTTKLTKTGVTTGTATMTYKYGLDVEVNGTTTTDSASLTKPILTLVNQNGVVVVLDTTTYTGTVTVPGVTGDTTPWATIGMGVINYNDGTTESFN
jgi:hypothetical protein